MQKDLSKCFTVCLKAEDSGIFRQGWSPNELEKVEVICQIQSDIESGTLAAVAFKGSSEILLKRVYKSAHCIVLEAPKNFDRPDEIMPSTVLTQNEASKVLTILGKVVRFSLTLKDKISEVA